MRADFTPQAEIDLEEIGDYMRSLVPVAALAVGQSPTNEVICTRTFLDLEIRGAHLLASFLIDETPTYLGACLSIHKPYRRR